MKSNLRTGKGIKVIAGGKLVADLFRDAQRRQAEATAKADSEARAAANAESARNRAIAIRAEMIAKGAIVPK